MHGSSLRRGFRNAGAATSLGWSPEVRQRQLQIFLDTSLAPYPSVPFTWLDTEGGDQFVFMLRYDDLP